jgi:aminoglycoside phosphotransferase (APT) family kinase protein
MGADKRVAALMARAGIPADAIVASTPLAGGTYNTLYLADLADGSRLVFKVPPPPHLPRLRYEAELLTGEAQFCAGAAAAGVPAPRVLHAEPKETAEAGAFLVMTHCPGAPWQSVAGEMAPAERDRLRGELGAMVARLHAVRGPGFGYPAGSVAPLTDRWAPAFTAMAAAALEDAERYGAWLPVPVPDIRRTIAAAGASLAEVTVPALVHFDLWPGNVLLDGPAGERGISGLIDGERMFWGDPLADFASLSLFGTDAEDDAAFRAGYTAAGGRIPGGGHAGRRLALYRAYLYLIMLVEVVPRGTAGEHLAWVREFAGAGLSAQLALAAVPESADGVGGGRDGEPDVAESFR